jgi:hypothetical protein
MRQIAIAATAAFLLAGTGTADARWYGYHGYGGRAVVTGAIAARAFAYPSRAYSYAYGGYYRQPIYYGRQYAYPQVYYVGGYGGYVGPYVREIRRQNSGETYR